MEKYNIYFDAERPERATLDENEILGEIEDKFHSLESRLVSFIEKNTQNLGAELDEKISKVNDAIPDATIELDSLYTLYGLRETQKREVYQNFDVAREGINKNAVQFLWADTLYGNEVHAKIIPNSEGYNYLRIHFNVKDARDKFPNMRNWGCNVAIKPQDDLAVDNNTYKRRLLVFDARVPQEEFDKLKRNTGLVREVGIAVRVVNGYMQHWEYGSNKRRTFIHFPVRLGEGWQEISLDLSNGNRWALFDSDGLIERGPSRPIFDVISSLVIKLGKANGGFGELDPGLGIIDIRNIRLQ